MNTNHRPNKKQAMLFFFFTIAAAVFVVLWVFVINKGKLSIEGKPPYSVKIAGREKPCAVSLCAFKLSPKKYAVTIKKEGFYDDVKEVTVERSGETKIKAEFRFIPKLQEINGVILPVENAPLRPPFIGMQKFANFPKNTKEVLFSASGEQALLKLGKELYLYNVKDQIVGEIALDLENHPGWAGKEIVFLAESGNKQILKIWNKGKPQTVVSFDKPFKNPKLSGPASGAYVLIDEESNGAHGYYLININKKTRKRLAVGSEKTSVKWAGDYLILTENEQIFTVDSDSLTRTNLAAVNSDNVIEKEPGILIFLTAAKQDPGVSRLGPSINEVLEETKKEVEDIKKTPASVFISEFRVSSGEYKTLAEVPIKEGENISRLAADLNGKKLYFEKDGKLFAVTLVPGA